MSEAPTATDRDRDPRVATLGGQVYEHQPAGKGRTDGRRRSHRFPPSLPPPPPPPPPPQCRRPNSLIYCPSVFRESRPTREGLRRRRRRHRRFLLAKSTCNFRMFSDSQEPTSLLTPLYPFPYFLCVCTRWLISWRTWVELSPFFLLLHPHQAGQLGEMVESPW